MQNMILYAELKQETSHLLTYKAEDLQENSSVAVFIPITFQSHLVFVIYLTVHYQYYISIYSTRSIFI